MLDRLRYLSVSVAALGVFAMGGTRAAAQTIIDQEQPLMQGGFPFQQFWIAQSFKTKAGNVSGAGLTLRNIAGNPDLSTESSDITINLWTELPSSQSAIQLASGTSTATGAYYGQDVWVDVFWAPVIVDPETTYWLTVGSSNPIFQANFKGDDFYADGFAAHSSRTTVSPLESSPYDLFDSVDLNFRTFTTVPEPSTIHLMLIGLGFIGVGTLRRSRRVDRFSI